MTSKRSRTAPFHVMEVAKAATARQASHGDAIWLCVGQPSTPAPAVVRDRAARAVREEVLGYTVAAGTAELREVIAEEYRRRYQVNIPAEQVLVTTGSSGGFQLALLAALDAGQPVAMTRPGYPAYRNTLAALGHPLLDLDAGAAVGYQPDIAMLDALPESPAALIVASPANPTGTIIAPDRLAELAGWCEQNDCWLISDEIYHQISFGERCASAREFSERAIVVGSLSKYQSMTGWRLGWLIVPEELVEPLDRLQSNLAICAPAVSQAAALAAFEPAARVELDQHVERYRVNRDLLLSRLGELGITRFAPADGAFYAWCDISHLTDDSLRWCAEVLAATGVAIAPGIDFDPVEGHHKVRFSLCGQTAELNEAIDRLVAYLAG